MTQIEQETMSLIKSACKKYTSNEIDWEKRRYEIARDTMVGMITNSNVVFGDKQYITDSAIEYADLLIEKLRNKTTKDLVNSK